MIGIIAVIILLALFLFVLYLLFSPKFDEDRPTQNQKDEMLKR